MKTLLKFRKILKLVEKDFVLSLENNFTFSNYSAHFLKKDSIFDNNSMMLSSLSWASIISNDFSEEVSHHWFSISMNDVIFMMRLWYQETEISQQQYSSLLEVLKLFKNTSIIFLLFQKLFQLKVNIQSQLSLLSLWQK